MQKFDDFISLSGDYESRMCPSLCVCHNLNVLIFCQFSAFKEIVESDTFFGGLGESWLEEGLKEKVAGDLWYFPFLFSSQNLHRYSFYHLRYSFFTISGVLFQHFNHLIIADQ